MKTSQLIALFFAVVILLGTVLLMLPISSKAGTWTPFINALFTSTSANCITGLIVYDTYSYWSIFGQIVILVLVQIGGIGFMSIATFFSLILRRKIGLSERMLLKEVAGSMQLAGVVRLVKNILFGTFIVEGIGAILLAIRFCPKMGLGEGIYYAIFHSVTSYCNAGFDLFGKYQQFSSLSTISNDWFSCSVIAALIIVGGMGFLVWKDILNNKLHWDAYMLQTKIVITTSAILIFGGALLIFIFEYNNTLESQGPVGKVLQSLFMSITPRTAGFEIYEIETLSEFTRLLTIFLMIIGGSPGSTAGGIKTTTIFIAMAAVVATLKNKPNVTAFKRRFDDSALRKACSIVVVYVILSLLGIMIINLLQPLSLEEVVFECISAISTTGLSKGITGQLDVASKLVLIVLMLFGRIGVLSIISAFMKEYIHVPLQFPKEDVIIG